MMGTFLDFLKFIYSSFFVDEDEENEPPSYGYRKISQKSIYKDFHGSDVSASQLSSNISANRRSSEEGTKNGHRSVEKNQLSVRFSDPAIKKVQYADSYVCSVRDSSQSGSTPIHRDFHDSGVSASHLSSNINANRRNSEEGTKNDHHRAERNLLSVQFSDLAVKKVSSTNSSACSVRDSSQPGSTLIHRNFHGSGVSASQLSSNINANRRSSEEGTKNGHQSAEKNLLSVRFLDPAIKKVQYADSSICSVRDSSQSGSTSTYKYFQDSGVSTSHLLSNNSVNTRSSEEGTKDGHPSAEKNQLIKKRRKKKKTAIKKVPSADSSVCSLRDSSQSGSTLYNNNYSSKGKGTCLQKATTQPDSNSMVSKQIALDKRRVRLNTHPWNSQNDQLPSSTSHCGHLMDRSYDELIDVSAIASFLSEYIVKQAEQKLHYSRKFLERQNPGNKVSTVSVKERKFQDYCSSQKILLVGEGDFSFSTCLAKAFKSATSMVATSLNSEEYLRKHYGKATGNISKLRVRGCLVLHEVDATDVANHGIIKDLKFDRIIYNFPHCGDFRKSEAALRKNQRLVGLFMENSAKLITKDGEIHIRHKCSKFFLRWDLSELASQAGLRLKQETPFNACVFPGYTPKYGFERGRFNSDEGFACHPSHTYKFVLRRKKLRKKKKKPIA